MGEIWLEMAAKWDRMAELAELNLGGDSRLWADAPDVKSGPTLQAL
jgi:hypothetical protein